MFKSYLSKKRIMFKSPLVFLIIVALNGFDRFDIAGMSLGMIEIISTVGLR